MLFSLFASLILPLPFMLRIIRLCVCAAVRALKHSRRKHEFTGGPRVCPVALNCQPVPLYQVQIVSGCSVARCDPNYWFLADGLGCSCGNRCAPGTTYNFHQSITLPHVVGGSSFVHICRYYAH